MVTGTVDPGRRRVMGRTFSIRRVLAISIVLTLAGAGVLLIVGRPEAAGALTVSGGVAIINLRWLDSFLGRLLQPGRARLDGRAVVTLLLRMGLILGVVAGLVLVGPGVGVAVGAGFTVPLIVLVVEGVRTIAEGES